MDKADLEKRLEEATKQHAGFLAQFQEMQATVLRSEGVVMNLRHLIVEQDTHDKSEAESKPPEPKVSRQQRRAALREAKPS